MRARVKALKDLPESYSCCQEQQENMKKFEYEELELSGKLIIRNTYCQFCNSDFGEQPSIVTNKGTTISLNTVDIDEGGSENAQI